MLLLLFPTRSEVVKSGERGRLPLEPLELERLSIVVLGEVKGIDAERAGVKTKGLGVQLLLETFSFNFGRSEVYRRGEEPVLEVEVEADALFDLVLLLLSIASLVLRGERLTAERRDDTEFGKGEGSNENSGPVITERISAFTP